MTAAGIRRRQPCCERPTGGPTAAVPMLPPAGIPPAEVAETLSSATSTNKAAFPGKPEHLPADDGGLATDDVQHTVGRNINTADTGTIAASGAPGADKNLTPVNTFPHLVGRAVNRRNRTVPTADRHFATAQARPANGLQLYDRKQLEGCENPTCEKLGDRLTSPPPRLPQIHITVHPGIPPGLLQQGELQLETTTSRNTATILKILCTLVAAGIAASCGGPHAVLHDVIDDAEERVELLLSAYDETDDELEEATSMELHLCPGYNRPPLHDGLPAYENEVEAPEILVQERLAGRHNMIGLSSALRRRARTCADANSALKELPERRQRQRTRYEDFFVLMDETRELINNFMTNEEAAEAAASLEAIDAARADEDDTLQNRFNRLNNSLMEAMFTTLDQIDSARADGDDRLQNRLGLDDALVKMAEERVLGAIIGGANSRPGLSVNPGRIPDPEAGGDLDPLIRPWLTIIEEHEEAADFVKIANHYRRRIYEGPDVPDPDDNAAGWEPVTGTWNGELGYLLTSRTFPRERRYPAQITFQADGSAITEYPILECTGSLELSSTGGAHGRTKNYRQIVNTEGRNCRTDRTVMLERVEENTIWFSWWGRPGTGVEWRGIFRQGN